MSNILNLVPAIREIEKVINEKERQFNKEIEPYRKSLEQLRLVNEACEKCGGLGKRLRSRSCAEDDRPDPSNPEDWIKCVECWGTGIQRKENLTVEIKRLE